MLTVTAAIPTDGILPDRVKQLALQADGTNGSEIVSISDSNNANVAGLPLAAGVYMPVAQSEKNTICLRDYYIKGSAASQKFNVRIEY